jgi:hypothetical protein
VTRRVVLDGHLVTQPLERYRLDSLGFTRHHASYTIIYDYLYLILSVILCGDSVGIGHADEAEDGAHSCTQHEPAGGTGRGTGAFQIGYRMDILCVVRRAVTTITWCVRLVYICSLPLVSAAIIRFSLSSAAFWLFRFLSADLFGAPSFGGGGGFGSTSVTGHVTFSTTSASGHVKDPAVPGGSSIYDRSRDHDHTEWHWPSSAKMHGLHYEPRQSMMDAVRMAVSGGRSCCGRGRGSDFLGQGMSLGLCLGPGMALALCLGFSAWACRNLMASAHGHGMARTLCLGYRARARRNLTASALVTAWHWPSALVTAWHWPSALVTAWHWPASVFG